MATRYPHRSLLALAIIGSLWPRPSGALDPERSLSQYVRDQFTDRQGLPQNSPRALLVSRRGDIWIGTDEGVARFDGARFTVYDRRSAPALRSNLVYSLSEDASGSLWIGTLDAGVYRLEAGRLGPAAFPRPLPSDQVTALLDDGQGVLWIGTRKGLARVEGGEMRTFDLGTGLPHPEVRSLAQDRRGRLWVGTIRGTAIIEDGAVHAGPPELRDVVVNAVLEDRGGNVWFGTEGRGLAMLPGDGDRLRFLGAAEGVPPDVKALHLDRDGSLWLGGSAGLTRLRQGWRADRLVRREGGDVLRAWAIDEDHEGNLWIGYEGGGLERLRDGDFVTVGQEEGLAHELAMAVVEDARGDLFIGTFGGMSRAPGGDVRHIESVLRTRRPVTSLASDPEGTIWVGLLDGSIVAFRGGRARRVAPPSAGRTVSSLATDSSGAVLAGTFQGLFRLDRHRLVPDGDVGLPAGVRINALAFAPDGALWAGLEYHGAYRRPQGGHFERAPGGPPAGHDVNDFLFDADGTVWIGTLGAGLWRWRAGLGAGLTTARGLFDDTIWRILDDGLGHLWLSCNKGVFRVDRLELSRALDDGAGTVTSSAYGIDDGMRSRECNGGVQPAGWRTADGRLWFPTVRGLSVVDPARLRPPLSAPVVIDRTVVDGLERPPPRELTLAPGAARLAVGYTALAFSAPERVRFRYRLEPLDRGWIDAAGDRTAVYTNLPPGSYRFVVEARVGIGPFGEPAVLPVTQLPRLFERRWFWPSAATAALALLAIALAARARQVRVRELTLHQRVRQALDEVQKLEGLLPICAWCKKVRDDEGYWKAIEVYLHDRGVANFTHGMCPDCLARHYRESEEP